MHHAWKTAEDKRDWHHAYSHDCFLQIVRIAFKLMQTVLQAFITGARLILRCLHQHGLGYYDLTHQVDQLIYFFYAHSY